MNKKQQLKKGIKEEMEHTSGNKLTRLKHAKTPRQAASIIAKDHIKKNPRAYK